MAVKLIDLQVLYGIAGARDAFERLVAKLLKAEHPHAETVRVKKGDDGIDVYIGKFDDAAGIDVFQCKYFFLSVGSTQQGQIRKSFNRVKNSKKFKARTWTLCLPLDLAADERVWFDAWKAKQVSTGIKIEDPWTALKLEALLCEEKNRGIKEEYFRQEHLTQIREMHGMLQNLFAGLVARLQEEMASREQAMQIDVVDRFNQFAERIAGEVRNEHAERLRQANRAGPQPAQWEVIIRPSWLHEPPRRPSLGDCLTHVQRCQREPGELPYPEVVNATQNVGQDWAGMWYAHNGKVECWHFATREVFAHVFTVPEYLSHQHGFAVDQAVLRLKQMFHFAKALAEQASDKNDGQVEVTIRLSGIQGRTLILPNGVFRGAQDQIDYTATCKRVDLLRDPDSFARKAALHFFERFGWLNVKEEMLAEMQHGLRRWFTPTT